MTILLLGICAGISFVCLVLFSMIVTLSKRIDMLAFELRRVQKHQ